jgi:hypothetical protein
MRYILFVLCATSCLLAPALAEPPAPPAGPSVENVSPPTVPVTPAKPSVENMSPPSPPCAAQDDKLELLKTNIGWIKDIVTLVFAGTATVIAIFAYRRARATILQPIRLEAIKKQSELLARLLTFLRDSNHSFENSIDYVTIVQINVLCALRDYGFVFKGQESILKKLDEEIHGWIPCGESRILQDVEIIATFESENETPKQDSLGKQRYADLKNRTIEIDKIYETKTLSQFLINISEFSNDPFMPQSIQSTISELLASVNQNLTSVLKSEIEVFMLSFGEKYFKTGEAPKFDPVGVYNSFNHKRAHHRSSVEQLRKEIRKHLLIDEPW